MILAQKGAQARQSCRQQVMNDRRPSGAWWLLLHACMPWSQARARPAGGVAAPAQASTSMTQGSVDIAAADAIRL